MAQLEIFTDKINLNFEKKIKILDFFDPSFLNDPAAYKRKIIRYSKVNEAESIKKIKSGLQDLCWEDDQIKKCCDLYLDIKTFNLAHYATESWKLKKRHYITVIDSAAELIHLAGLPCKEKSILAVLDNSIAEFLGIISVIRQTMDIKTCKFVTENLALYIKSEFYKRQTVEKGSVKALNKTIPPGNARTIVLTAAANMLVQFKEPWMHKFVQTLMSDHSLPIRYRALFLLHYYYENDKNAFWRIVQERISTETDAGCLQLLLYSLAAERIISDDAVAVEDVFLIFSARFKNKFAVANIELLRSFYALKIKFMSIHAKEKTYQDFLSYTNGKDFSTAAIWQVSQFLFEKTKGADFYNRKEEIEIFSGFVDAVIESDKKSFTTNAN